MKDEWWQAAVAVLTLLLGGGGLTGYLLGRRKSAAEAAEIEARAEAARAAVWQNPFKEALELVRLYKEEIARLREELRAAGEREEALERALAKAQGRRA